MLPLPWSWRFCILVIVATTVVDVGVAGPANVVAVWNLCCWIDGVAATVAELCLRGEQLPLQELFSLFLEMMELVELSSGLLLELMCGAPVVVAEEVVIGVVVAVVGGCSWRRRHS